jgi:8-oxo-dGTP diphosphatase
MLGKKFDIPEVKHPASGLHLHNVEAKSLRFGRRQGQEGPDRPTEGPALATVDRVEPGHKGALRPGLHLDEDKGPLVAANEVDLLAPVARIAPVAVDDLKPELPPEMSPGPSLPVPSDACRKVGRPGPEQALHRAEDVEASGHGLRPNMTTAPTAGLDYKIAVLVFLENRVGEHLLLLRAKAPNLGVWSPIGGKLETGSGESPFECARRETLEETGLAVEISDLHLFAMIAEKAYEGRNHWLMFLFRCRRPVPALPPDIKEGRFGFFSRPEVAKLDIPETDRSALWPIYDRYRDGFVALRADCAPGSPVTVTIEQIL